MKYCLILFFVTAGIFFSWLGWASTNIAGGEDGIYHFLFAKYAAQHPENLLNLWAKPLFTLFLFPFAQFGFFASQLFNVLAALLAAWFTYKSAEKLQLSFAFLAAPFLLLAVIYFFCIPSVITEILFSLLFAAALFALLKNRYILAAILVSFLPFVRQEGYIIILMFFFCLIFLRQYKSLPWLALGILLFTVVGGFYLGDFLWLINDHPYGDVSDVYSKGNFLHYIDSQRYIWGSPLLVLMLLGTIVFVVQLVRNIRKRQALSSQQIVLLFAVFGSFYAFLFGHSYVLWKGNSASIGLIRVMASTMPAAVIIGHYGFHFLLEIFNPRLKLLKYFLAAVAVYAFVQANIDAYKTIPFKGDKEQELIIKSAEWYRNSPYYKKSKVYFGAPSVAYFYGFDPFDPKEGAYLHAPTVQQGIMPAGTIVVWDAHFGPNEAGIKLADLQENPLYEQLAHFGPEKPFITFNGYTYEIYLFRKK